MGANPSANARQGIGLPRQTIGFLESSFRNEPDVASSVGMCRTSHHAGEIRMQPIPIDPLVSESFEHGSTFKEGTRTK